MIKPKEVVVILIHKEYSLYLLQLRDMKPNILHPGHWGPFGGGVEYGESPKDAAIRELKEEIEYSPKNLHFFRNTYDNSLKLLIHIYFCSLEVELSELSLLEGMGMGLFNKEKILNGKIKFEEFNCVFPVAPQLMQFVEKFSDYYVIPKKY